MKSLKSIALFSFAFFLLVSCQKENLVNKDLRLDLESAANGAQVTGEPEFVPNELLVKFKKGTTAAARGKAFGLLKAALKERIHTAAMKHFGDDQGLFLLSVNINALDAITNAKSLEDIEFAQPNWIYQHTLTPNDPSFSQLWGMQAGFGSNATSAWDSKTNCSDVVVGVIDEGIQVLHPDLKNNIWENIAEKNGISGIDDDKNGYVDDLNGWDFVNNDRTVYDGGTSGTADTHGTHVAGTIGAQGNNLLGVAGVCWGIKIISTKFLGKRGGTTANAVKALDYLTKLRINGISVVATNNSWGGGAYDLALFESIWKSNNVGIMFICAAGNSTVDLDLKKGFPASYMAPNQINVASIDKSGIISSFSNFGAKTVHLGAPGGLIYSTYPSNKYNTLSGTSMATPHVTGAVAMYRSKYPNATVTQVVNAINISTIPTVSMNGKTISNGRLDVSKFIATTPF